MTRSITDALAELKCSIRDSLDPEIIYGACLASGHEWRERVLGPVNTVWVFALQIVHMNTACSHAVRLLPGIQATGNAYGQARARIPLAAFQRLVGVVTRRLLGSIDAAVQGWHGHRVFYIDGSTCSMPDIPMLQAEFGQPTGQKPGCGFPVAKLVGLFHGGSGLLVDLLVQPLYTHEARVAFGLFKWLRRGDVLVGDRAFSSYAILATLSMRGVHAVMREHQSRSQDFRRGRCIAVDDRVLDLPRPRTRPSWMDDDEFDRLPDQLTIRRVRYRVTASGYRSRSVVLCTMLLDAQKYPLTELASLYGERWEVETCFRHLKQTLHMDVLRCKTSEGVRKELCMYTIVYNLVRTIMVQAGLERGVPPDRISLIDVVRCMALGAVNIDCLPIFVVNPHRPGRHQPRAIKRRPKQYPRLTHPRSRMHKAMQSWTL